MDFIECPSPNFDQRALPVSIIVLHYTGMPDAAAALDRLTSPHAKLSAHYLVDEDGSVFRLVDEGHRAFVYTNRALRGEVLRIFDSTFAITYALELIAIVVAMLGVAGTLLTLVLERRRELRMLRLIGALRRQVQRVVVIEAALIGTTSMVIGLVTGLALSLLLVYVINVQSFGWTIQFRVPVLFLAQVSLAVIAATAIAGFLPARKATQLVVEHEE